MNTVNSNLGHVRHVLLRDSTKNVTRGMTKKYNSNHLVTHLSHFEWVAQSPVEQGKCVTSFKM
jgi:hypothetical protein